MVRYDVSVFCVNTARDFTLGGIVEVRETSDQMVFEHENGNCAVYFKQHIIGYDMIKEEE